MRLVAGPDSYPRPCSLVFAFAALRLYAYFIVECFLKVFNTRQHFLSLFPMVKRIFRGSWAPSETAGPQFAVPKTLHDEFLMLVNTDPIMKRVNRRIGSVLLVFCLSFPQQVQQLHCGLCFATSTLVLSLVFWIFFTTTGTRQRHVTPFTRVHITGFVLMMWVYAIGRYHTGIPPHPYEDPVSFARIRPRGNTTREGYFAPFGMHHDSDTRYD